MNYNKIMCIIIMTLALAGCGWFSDFQLMREADRIDVPIIGKWSDGQSDPTIYRVERRAKGSYVRYTLPTQSDIKYEREECLKDRADEIAAGDEEAIKDCQKKPEEEIELFETYRLPNTNFIIFALPNSSRWEYGLGKLSANRLQIYEGDCQTGTVAGFIGDSGACRILNRQALLQAAYNYINSAEAFDPEKINPLRRIR